jgi:hypothetical protein
MALAACTAFAATCSKMAAPMKGPAGGIGLSVPSELLRYHEASGLPAYCRTPASVLAEVQQRIRGANSGATADLLNGPILRITSPLDDPGLACTDTYVAELWTERVSTSTTDYFVRGFAWLKRSCGADVFEARSAASRQRAAVMDKSVDETFLACRESR